MGAIEPPKKVGSLSEYFQKGYLLVVDDSANMRKTIKTMLAQQGVANVLEAEDGDDALRLLKKEENGPCLFVLLDWNMPRLPGIHVTREIRSDAKLGDIPIVMITSEINKEQITQAAELGITGYMIKPFLAKMLGEKILAVLKAKENPSEFARILKTAEMLSNQGQYDKALQLYNMALSKNSSAQVMVQIADIHEKMGQDDHAIRMYEKAVENNPMFLKAHVKTAEFHQKNGNIDDALVSLKKAAEISPGNPERHFMIAKMHLKKGDSAAAHEHFGQVIKHAPEKAHDVASEFIKDGSPEQAHEFAELMLSIGKPEMAEAVFRKTLEGNSQNINVFNRLGIALRRQGKWREAIKEYEKAINIEPNNEALYFNMAKAYSEGREFEASKKFFNKVLQINPDLEEAKKELLALEKAQ